MNIIVTGASGFIGSNFINNNTDHHITCVDLHLNDINLFNFSGYDVILHCAALVHQMKGIAEHEYFKVNSYLTFKTAQKAKAEGVHQFIFLSSVKVYGESTINESSWNEISECNPLDGYGRSKLDAERRILNLEDEKFKICIIRSPLVYGAGVKANMFNLVWLIDTLFMLPFGNINNKRSFVYIKNLISLINHIIKSGTSGIYLARDNESLSTTDLAIKICKALNKKCFLISIPSIVEKLISKVMPSFYSRIWGSLEINPIRGWNTINFTPPFTIDNGINEMVDWYLDNKYTSLK